MAKKKTPAAAPVETAAEPEAEAVAEPIATRSRRVPAKPRGAVAAAPVVVAAAPEAVPEPLPALDAPPARRSAAASAEKDSVAFTLDGENAAWTEGDEWVEDIDSAYLQSKYTLVSVAAKRARQLLGGSKRRVDSLSEKPVTVALEELSQGKLIFERTREGIK